MYRPSSLGKLELSAEIFRRPPIATQGLSTMLDCARWTELCIPIPCDHIPVRSWLLGARQASCHLSHAAKGCLFVLPIAMATTDSRSGLSVTGPAEDQFRVWRDQRAGWRSRASTYSA